MLRFDPYPRMYKEAGTLVCHSEIKSQEKAWP